VVLPIKSYDFSEIIKKAGGFNAFIESAFEKKWEIRCDCYIHSVCHLEAIYKKENSTEVTLVRQDARFFDEIGPCVPCLKSQTLIGYVTPAEEFQAYIKQETTLEDYQVIKKIFPEHTVSFAQQSSNGSGPSFGNFKDADRKVR
jgi:hypothetical protein